MTPTAADIRLKPLTPDDLEAVIAIDTATSGTSRRGYFEKRLTAAIERPQDYVFVGLSADGVLVGFAFAKVVSGAFGQTGASASLDAIGVSPDHGMQGFGHKLLAEVESVLRHKGVTTLASQIDWPEQPILSFMAHAGFVLAPRLVLSRPTREIAVDLEDEVEVEELDYSSPDGDARNALSHDRIPVRTMKEGDLAKIVSIDTANTGTDRRDYFARKQHESLHQSGVQVSLVAEQDGFPVGFIMARVDFGEFGRTSTEAVMDSIGVDPGFQGQGVGRALMAKLMANLGILQVETVRTEVDWNDTRLIDYFAQVGFTPAQRITLQKTL
ncbi:MAG: GNAT family N-acetyltransferase [Antarcticimicrobium sp.]|uniref:GNAT family N-acetyltransferase n=1 Tax=Antarcticimicrobium sp. TaxID=2824147 RepID=UPI002619CE2B|nr:GNAT family N-acetyltransferase [Antarcticimicrobium sp.]MDF1717747.1 GNAT family N-acetyltransferase [Antarcticimicrobium sp.]